jgi:hypothetical protein
VSYPTLFFFYLLLPQINFVNVEKIIINLVAITFVFVLIFLRVLLITAFGALVKEFKSSKFYIENNIIYTLPN